MDLKPRLQQVADLIIGGSMLCDIGSDHAYLPIYAIKNGICQKAVAADVRVGPVKTAMRNVTKYGLESRIEVRLGGGLQPIHEDELGTVVIAGMGGILITEILQESFEKAVKTGLLVLQPMNAQEEVRKYLYENGFEILSEHLAKEERKIYNIFCARWTGRQKHAEAFDCYIGDRLLESGDKLLQAYLEKRLGQLDTAISGMEIAKEPPEALVVFRSIRDRLMKVMQMEY